MRSFCRGLKVRERARKRDNDTNLKLLKVKLTKNSLRYGCHIYLDSWSYNFETIISRKVSECVLSTGCKPSSVVRYLKLVYLAGSLENNLYASFVFKECKTLDNNET